MNTRYELINALIKARKYTSFLEIGTAGGETFRAVEAVEGAGALVCRM